MSTIILWEHIGHHDTISTISLWFAEARCQSFRWNNFRDTEEEPSLNEISETTLMLHYVTMLEVGTEIPFLQRNSIYTCSDPDSTDTHLLLSNDLC